jgi:hypothetical protein
VHKALGPTPAHKKISHFLREAPVTIPAKSPAIVFLFDLIPTTYQRLKPPVCVCLCRGFSLPGQCQPWGDRDQPTMVTALSLEQRQSLEHTRRSVTSMSRCPLLEPQEDPSTPPQLGPEGSTPHGLQPGRERGQSHLSRAGAPRRAKDSLQSCVFGKFKLYEKGARGQVGHHDRCHMPGP